MTGDQVNEIVRAIRLISHGEMQPGGMELLGMALAGESYPGRNSVLDGLNNIASAITDLADAIRETRS